MRLIEFGAKWCGVCRGMKPVVEKIVNAKHINKEYVDLETDLGQRLANIAGVSTLPTYIVIKDDSKPITSLSTDDFHGCRLAVGQLTESNFIKKLGLG